MRSVKILDYYMIAFIRHCFLRLGILVEITNYFDQDYTSVRIVPNTWMEDNMVWYSMDSMRKIKYYGEVYDFNMQDNHNYTVVNLGLVHNSGRRNGSIACYLEPHHADIEEFLMLRRNTGVETERARDLFYALWL